MDKEGFQDTIRKQYIEEIHEAYLECEHGKTVDFILLNQALTRLMKSAKSEGLPAKEFMELVKNELGDAWARIEPTWFKVA